MTNESDVQTTELRTSTCLLQFSHKTRQTMLLYAYFTPKVDFKRNFNHLQSFLYEWRLTAWTIRKFRIGPSVRIESRIGRTIRNRIESRSFAGPYRTISYKADYISCLDMAGEVVRSRTWHDLQPLKCGTFQSLAMIWVCNADQFVSALSQVLAKQMSDAIFCHDVVHMSSCCHHTGTLASISQQQKLPEKNKLRTLAFSDRRNTLFSAVQFGLDEVKQI